MNIDHLKYFVDAALAGGISPSARKNFLTQSAISRAIAKLEDDLGVELVLHKQNRFQLTEAGEAILAGSHELLESISRLKDVASGHTKTLKGPMRVGCNQAIASRLLGPMLLQIEAKYPALKPVIKLGNTDQIQQMIDNLEIDFGIVLNDGEVEKLYQTTKLYSGEFIVVKSPKFSKKNPLESLIVSRTRTGGMSERYFRAYKKAYGTVIEPKLVVSSWQVIMDLAILGYGSALVPQFLCEQEIAAKLLEEYKHKVKPLSFDLCVIVGKNRMLPKNASALLECFGGDGGK